ncbi:hypothetical protein IB642_00765 [Allofrancisella guangzhouensis]|uniref:Lipoprotein n=1 Tax=Allofrancisella guangzhouensis TaxID=594679 RepID=A0A0A8E8D0_9GAMM|nr:hypothetical protein [Allofrancisella guangzhouensis]AJC48406.1 hypothetical protein SD28_01400 [Allofrancisella guangzhouensis]MBK2027295.1 hypothetical protein [Allofrancisella guangzhouensis]MBK2043549.1 hypothetical protein [Allofrancisella guangzhouensis]MBK2045481.1 hypothetical protein [Allofrancisella guangzhouensis]
MKRRVTTLMFLFGLVLSGCIPVVTGSFVTHDDIFDSDAGLHSLELQEGITVKQLYDAIRETISVHPKEFKLQASDYKENESRVWAFSNKYNQPIAFYAINIKGRVYLGIDIGDDGDANKIDHDIKDIYSLEDLILSNIKVPPKENIAG